MDVRVKCPRCGTEYFEPLEECDWCPEVKPEPVEQTKHEEQSA